MDNIVMIALRVLLQNSKQTSCSSPSTLNTISTTQRICQSLPRNCRCQIRQALVRSFPSTTLTYRRPNDLCIGTPGSIRRTSTSSNLSESTPFGSRYVASRSASRSRALTAPSQLGYWLVEPLIEGEENFPRGGIRALVSLLLSHFTEGRSISTARIISAGV